jgi:hypothetical protein
MSGSDISWVAWVPALISAVAAFFVVRSQNRNAKALARLQSAASKDSLIFQRRADALQDIYGKLVDAERLWGIAISRWDRLNPNTNEDTLTQRAARAVESFTDAFHKARVLLPGSLAEDLDWIVMDFSFIDMLHNPNAESNEKVVELGDKVAKTLRKLEAAFRDALKADEQEV